MSNGSTVLGPGNPGALDPCRALRRPADVLIFPTSEIVNLAAIAAVDAQLRRCSRAAPGA